MGVISMTKFMKTRLASAAILIAGPLLFVASANAATAPADPCTLLTAAQVSSALAGTYVAPQKTVAPRPYRNTVEGTDCNYRGNRGGELLFRIYFDPSAGDATSLFAKLKMFYGPPTPVSIGDEAYFDGKGALHARKGNVRFYLEAGEGKQAALTALGGIVAGQL